MPLMRYMYMYIVVYSLDMYLSIQETQYGAVITRSILSQIPTKDTQ